MAFRVSAKDPVFYLHIPKTGGQTLATRLASSFTPQQTWILQNELRFPDDAPLLDKLTVEKRFIEAHVSGELLREPRAVSVLTTVRNPLDQMIANYRHIRREPDNIWHRAAVTLSVSGFFDQFGDFFTDHQTNYLLSAYHPLQWAAIQEGRTRAYLARLVSTIERIRWLVPLEAVDEFVALWSVEMQRRIPNQFEIVNTAPPDGIDVEEVRAILLDRPHLYAIDAVLWDLARQAMEDYRRKMADSLVPWNWPDDSRRAYAHADDGVWLTDGWYDPEVEGSEYHWWAGPKTASMVRFRRSDEQKFLLFDVSVVNGIQRSDLALYHMPDGEPATFSIAAVAPGLATYCVSLAECAREGALRIAVPNAMAPIMTSAVDTDTRRRAFLASNWRLAAEPISE